MDRPSSFGPGGCSLWDQICEAYDLDVTQLVQLEEACRAKDRLDKLDLILSADVDTWAKLTVDVPSDGQVYELRITQALSQANATANLLKQLLAALRLPDAQTGKKPQYRGPRGAQKPSGKVSSLDRAREAKTGA